MQSVTESWTHGASLTACLQSEEQLASMRKKGVNNVMKEMIQKYLLVDPAKSGLKTIRVDPDEQFFEKQVKIRNNSGQYEILYNSNSISMKV